MAITPHPSVDVSGFKKIVAYSGVTNASGEYTVVYPVAYSVVPTVVPILDPVNTASQIIRLTASSTTGFTVKVEQRNSMNVVGVDVLLSATVNVQGAEVSVIVINHNNI